MAGEQRNAWHKNFRYPITLHKVRSEVYVQARLVTSDTTGCAIPQHKQLTFLESSPVSTYFICTSDYSLVPLQIRYQRYRHFLFQFTHLVTLMHTTITGEVTRCSINLPTFRRSVHGSLHNHCCESLKYLISEYVCYSCRENWRYIQSVPGGMCQTSGECSLC
jgi:hypothetical protein